MKRFGFTVFSLIILSTFLLKAQAPPYIPYQAIARDLSGQVRANSPIQVEFRIYNTMVASSAAYDEIHSVTTNDFGYFNLRIGAGTIQSGTFSAITWQTGDVSYEVWVDMGLGFLQLGGRTGFLSVPYALYAANSNPNPTLTINAPNTISNIAPSTYSINVPTPSLSVNGHSISVSNGNTVQLPEYTQGAGISISGTIITNTAPDQTVNISGAGVMGAYPNFTINPSAASTITSGNSNIVVSGAAPNFTITNTPSLSINSNQLSLSNGNTVTLPTTALTQGSNILLNGTSADYTISAVTPTLTTTGNVAINGLYPHQSIDVPAQVLSISGNTINLSNGGGSVLLPQAPATATISQGANVMVSGASSDYTISAVTPTLTTTGNASLSGNYPNQSIDVPAQVLSISGNTINLSNGGGSILLPQAPATTTISQGSNITVGGTSPNYTISAVTPTLTVTGNASVNGTYPNQSINVLTQTLSISGNTLNLSSGGGNVILPSTPATTISGGSNVIVGGASPNYTISAVTPTLTTTGNASVSGVYPNQSIEVLSQTLSISGNTLNLSAGGGSVTLPSTPVTSITPGTNVTVNGTAPNYTINSVSQTLSISGNTLNLSAGGGSVTLPASWNLTGNAGTSASINFIGTTDANDFVVKTANAERLRVTSTGSVGIGTTTPSADFDINTGNVKLGAGSTPFSFIKYGSLSTTFLLSIGNNANTLSIPGAQVGDIVVVTLNNHNAAAGSISLNNAYISAANTLSYNINTSVGLIVTLNFSYVLIRP